MVEDRVGARKRPLTTIGVLVRRCSGWIVWVRKITFVLITTKKRKDYDNSYRGENEGKRMGKNDEDDALGLRVIPEERPASGQRKGREKYQKKGRSSTLKSLRISSDLELHGRTGGVKDLEESARLGARGGKEKKSKKAHLLRGGGGRGGTEKQTWKTRWVRARGCRRRLQGSSAKKTREFRMRQNRRASQRRGNRGR